MAHSTNPDEPTPADEVLAAAARAGDGDAFGALWRRHSAAGMVAARQYARIADADDLLAEAYARILASFRRGNGPNGAFRPYLYRTIRNLAMDWRRPTEVPLDDAPDDELLLPGPEFATAERTIGFRAFRTLPERWQSVLWYLDVEGLEPAEAAPILGLSPNATSALAGRAREGLKKAWLQAHVNDGSVPEGCRWTTDRMGEFSRGGLSRRGRERFARHLTGCERCSALLEEVEDAGGRLAVILLPLFLGGSAAASLLADRSERGAPSASAPPSRGASPRSPGRRSLVAAGAVVVVAVAAVTGAMLAAALPGGGSEPAAQPPSAPTPAPSPPATSPPVRPPSEPEPSAPPESAPPPPRPPVAPPPPAPPPPVAPAVPSAPVVDFDPATGRVRLTGTGDVPGAVIQMWGTTTSLATSVTSAPILLASTVVAPDGSWLTPEAAGLTPINVTVTVRQVRDGLASGDVEVISDAFFGLATASTSAVVAGGTATWNLTGWPDAAWEIRESAGGTTVASGVIDANGTAVAVVTLPAATSGTVLSYDYGYVQDGAMAASSPGLTAIAP